MARRFSILTALTLGLASAPMASSAASVDAGNLLRSFNNIVLGDAQTTSETEGTVFIGGNQTGGAYVVNARNLPDGTVGPVSGSLVVGGNATMVTVENGDIVAGGTIGQLNNNGGGTVTQNAGNIPVSDVVAAFQALSSDLAAMDPTPGTSVNTDQNNLDIDNSAAMDGFAVINAPAGFLSTGGSNSRFASLDRSITTVVNIPGMNPNIGANLEFNAPNLLLNFFEAQTLNISSGVNFSILAPFADVALSGNTRGTLVSGSLRQSGEVRPYEDGTIFTGDFPTDEITTAVPLPAGALLLLTGLGAVAAVGRFRRAA